MKTWVGVMTYIALVAGATSGCGGKKGGDKDATHDSLPGEQSDLGPARGGAPGAAPVDAISALVERCQPSRHDACLAAEQKARNVEKQRATALENKDWSGFARLSLQLNHAVESLLLLAQNQDSPAAVAALQEKYGALTTQLDADLAAGLGGGAALPYVYQASETAAVAAVMQDFGPLYIKESPTGADGNPHYDELSVERPWSGFWFPASGNEMFDGEQAPLAKFDAAVVASGRASNAAAVEGKRLIGAADTWEGACNAWAMASIAAPEPQSDVYVHGVNFTPFDQKALLVKIHERVPTKVYGTRYYGDAVTDGSIQDIRPEAFHRVAMVMLGEKKKPFVIDDDAGPEMWSKPLYRLRWTIKKDEAQAHAYLVTALPWLIRHRDHADDIRPTDDGDRAAPLYEYRLWVDPTDVRDGMQRVIAGEWLGVSRNAHPDTITLPATGDTDKPSLNSAINAAMDVIRQVVTVN